MKISLYVWLIVLGVSLINPSYCAEAVDDQPVLRGGIQPSANSEPVFHDKAITPSKRSEANHKEDASKVTVDSLVEAKGKLGNNTAKKYALQGGVSHTEISDPDESASGQAAREIAAIGISWNLWNRVISYVDPGSDLFGKVEPGKDHFVGLGKLDATEVVRSGYNIGDSGTWVEAVIRGHDHVVRHIPVRRQPLSCFAPKFARSLARQYHLGH